MDIHFQIDFPLPPNTPLGLVETAIKATLDRFAWRDDLSLTVVITGNETIQQLNRQYRGLDAPTDVLAFQNEIDPDFPDQEGNYLGDIIIAYPVAQAQALAAGHTPGEELALLAVHGALHLVGFEHDTPEKKEKMWEAQQQIMAGLGLAQIQPTED